MFSQRNDFNRPRVLDRMKIAEINPLLSCLFTIDESPPTRVLAYEHPDRCVHTVDRADSDTS